MSSHLEPALPWLQPRTSLEAIVNAPTRRGGREVLRHVRLSVELARIGKLGKTYLRWTERLLHMGDLSARQKRTIALRAAWRNGCIFEWVHHSRLARDAGATDDDIRDVAQARNASWSDERGVMMAGVDDLLSRGALSDHAWEALGRYLSDVQRIEFCMVVGHSRMLSLILNSLELPLTPPVQADELPESGRLPLVQMAPNTAAVNRLPGYPDGCWKLMSAPRIHPLAIHECNATQRFFLMLARRAARSRTNLNVIATLMRMGKIFPYHLLMLSQLLRKGRMPRAEKEQVIMRVGWRTGNAYEWAHHSHIGRTAGLLDKDVAMVAEEESARWSPRQRALFLATDAMLEGGYLDVNHRARLLEHIDPIELIEFCFVVGHYSMIALTNNSLGVAVEPAFDPARHQDKEDIPCP